MSRRSRKGLSLVAIVALVMAQLALSAFACAMPAGAPVAAAPQCHEGMAQDAPLCQRHCHEEAQTQAPLAFAAAPFVASFVVFLAAPPSPGPAPCVPTRTLLHATSPPLAIANCCLRV